MAPFTSIPRSLAALALAGVAVLPAAPAAAVDVVRELYGRDDRVEVEATQYPYSAIGRLEMAGGRCTASLVAPRVVLTAAHCLFADYGAGSVFDRPLKFMAGYADGRSAAVSRVIDWWVPEEYDPDTALTDPASDGYDWAFLTLADPIGDVVGTLEVYAGLTVKDLEKAAHRGWDEIANAGYGMDNDEIQRVHFDCPILQPWPDNTFYHQCDELPGNSGGPLFIERGDTVMIVGIASTLATTKGIVRFGMAVDSRAFAPALAQYVRRLEKNDSP